jgi:hypothetical protein
VSSLTIVYELECGDSGLETAMLPLRKLRSPLNASRFLPSSLSSLRVVFEDWYGASHGPPLGRDCAQDVMKLRTAHAASFLSLRRLHIHIDYTGLESDDGEEGVESDDEDKDAERPFSSLALLPDLTHCVIYGVMPFSCSSLLSALSSLQSRTILDLGNSKAGPKLLQLLCADAASALLLLLKSLVLPAIGDVNDNVDDGDRVDELHNAFLCRLSSLPSPPALQRFSGEVNRRHRAAGRSPRQGASCVLC